MSYLDHGESLKLVVAGAALRFVDFDAIVRIRELDGISASCVCCRRKCGKCSSTIAHLHTRRLTASSRTVPGHAVPGSVVVLVM